MGLTSMLAMGASAYKGYEQMRVERQKLDLHNQNQRINRQINMHNQKSYDNMQDNLAKMFGAGLADEVGFSSDQSSSTRDSSNLKTFSEVAPPYAKLPSLAERSSAVGSAVAKPTIPKPAIDELNMSIPTAKQVSVGVNNAGVFRPQSSQNQGSAQRGENTTGQKSPWAYVTNERNRTKADTVVDVRRIQEDNTQLGASLQWDAPGFSGAKYKKPINSTYSSGFNRSESINSGDNLFSFKKFTF